MFCLIHKHRRARDCSCNMLLNIAAASIAVLANAPPEGGALTISPAECIAASENLPADQCAAWIELHDATGGEDWNYCSRARTDPCSCQIDGPTCNKDNTAIITFFMDRNNMAGSLPASFANLVNLTIVSLQENKLTGLLPEMPWASRTPKGGDFNCVLYDFEQSSPNNMFDCPLPAGALKHCYKYAKSKPVYRLVQATDCGPRAPTPPPTPMARYACINNKCTPSAQGVSLKRCHAACG